jgi:hypothetical protein
MKQNDLLKILLPKKDLGHIRIGEEDRMCIQFSNYLRQLTLEDKFHYVWFHVPNQFGSYKPIFGLKQGWMGRIPGVPDFCFMGPKSFFIEFKTSKGKTSKEQDIFIEWCSSCRQSVYICRSFEEAKIIIDGECSSVG